MNSNAMVGLAIRAGGFKASRYGHENAPGGSDDDSLETRSLFLGLDLALESGDAS
jgi:hypothetical protein